MRIENAAGIEVLERMLTAYGFTMQKELAEHLGIAKSNIAGWVQRDQVPGNAIIQCSLDTGVTVQWLVLGELANANRKHERSSMLRGKKLYEEIQKNGGKAVLQRVLEAYGFSLQKELCDQFQISSGTVSTWIRRNFFPGDIVVACAIETGTSLDWLALGIEKDENNNSKLNNFTLTKFALSAGKLIKKGEWICDIELITNQHGDYKVVEKEEVMYIIDFSESEIANGKYLLEVDGMHDIYDAYRVPRDKVKLKNIHFEHVCNINEIRCIGRIRKIIQNIY